MSQAPTELTAEQHIRTSAVDFVLKGYAILNGSGTHQFTVDALVADSDKLASFLLDGSLPTPEETTT